MRLPTTTTSLLLLISASVVSAFVPLAGKNEISNQTNNRKSVTHQKMADSAAVTSSSNRLFDPEERDSFYGKENGMNVAQYLLDLHNTRSTFDFCGGMMFQLVLTDALKEHLETATAAKPTIFDATQPRMAMIPDYSQTSNADNTKIFHGREIRNVPDAAGGMGMVLQLSLADDGVDPEGWTTAEIQRYDGWGHDSGREWRKGPQLEQEGFGTFREKFGPSAFSLHHRFYLHYDHGNRMWLSAEDGCEGTPSPTPTKGLSNLFGLL